MPTCGIGRSIEIEAFSGAQVIASRVDTLKLDGDDAEVEFHFEIEKSDMISSAECELTYTLEFEGKTVYTGKKTLMLGRRRELCRGTRHNQKREALVAERLRCAEPLYL